MALREAPLGSTVTTTLLFTDLVESTSLAARLGPARTDALRQVHFGLLRDALVAVNGTEVKNLGDGLMVAFTSSTRAVDCAVAMQQAIERHNRRAEEHLEIRIGISTGEAIEEDGDYFGTPVVEAARLCALARGGQILATDVVRAFVGMNASHTFLDMGALELKGLPAPVPTVEIAWESTAGRSLLPLPPRLAHQASNTRYGFCGRDIELTALVDAQKRAFNESCLHAMLVSGEAGIGKTTLIARATRDAHDNGVVVMFGHCDEELGIPYQPWIEALTPLAQHEDGALIRQLAPAHRGALARLLPSLIDASPTSGDRDSERLVLFEAVRSLLDTVTAESPLIVVLDDLHWADAASLHVLRYLVTASPATPVLVVSTYRDTDLSRDHPLASLLANFHRESRTERLALSGLSETSVQALMVEAAGHELGSDGVALAHALRRETDGNPFFTEELLRHLGETGTVAQDATGRWSLRGQLEDVSLPSSVTEVVARRVAGLGDDVARALSTAAVVGREFDLNVLTRVVDLDEDALLDALDAATTAGVIVEGESVAGGYRFTHALFQHTLYRDVSAPRRQRLHRRIAEAFEEIDAGRHEHVAELAHHWLAATRPAELDKAMEYVLDAADAARDALAPDDAARWYRQALDLLGDHTDRRLRARILVGLGEAQVQIGVPEFRDTLLEAGAIAREINDVELLVAAALGFVRGSGATTIVDDDRVEMTRAALEAVGSRDSGARARVLLALAEALDARDWERRRDLGAEAVEVARRVGDDAVLLVALTGAYQTASAPETLSMRLSTTQEAIDLADRIGDVLRGFTGRLARVDCCMQAGDLAEADRRIAEMREIADAVSLPRMRWLLEMSRSWRLMLAGRLEEAQEANDRAFEVGTRIGQPEALMVYGAQLFQIRTQRAGLGEIIDVLVETTAANPQIPSTRAMLAFAFCELERMDDARALFERDATNMFADIPRTNAWLSGIAMWADIAVDLGELEAAAELYKRLEPFADQVMMVYVVIVGSVARPLGRIAHALGRVDDAERHLRNALATHERMAAPYLIASTQLDLAEALAGRGAEDEVAELVSSAAATAQRHGYPRLEARARRLRNA